jgi:Kef-type K+ transport system membrane component KefB
LGGLSKRNALAVGFGLNARGAMEIILGTLAFEAGLITQPVFVALVIMALITSIASAPLMRRFVEEPVMLK